jgi:hypothetical protein
MNPNAIVQDSFRTRGIRTDRDGAIEPLLPRSVGIQRFMLENRRPLKDIGIDGIPGFG